MLSCSITTTRPAQELSDMETAVRAAREVQADTLAPELYRKASEVAEDARKEYRLKNYDKARSLCVVARKFAEKAEFEALKNGAKRDQAPPDPLATPSGN